MLEDSKKGSFAVNQKNGFMLFNRQKKSLPKLSGRDFLSFA